ncbi:hypothetical protein Pelo_4234 [Pelomyxa schiedti]|nr:hypothetical protein Pelo_4234 [Pelomyxa schiedti]
MPSLHCILISFLKNLHSLWDVCLPQFRSIISDAEYTVYVAEDLPFTDFALIFGVFCGDCPVWCKALLLCLACTENYCSASSVIANAFCCMLSHQVGAFTAIALLKDALPACWFYPTAAEFQIDSDSCLCLAGISIWTWWCARHYATVQTCTVSVLRLLHDADACLCCVHWASIKHCVFQLISQLCSNPAGFKLAYQLFSALSGIFVMVTIPRCLIQLQKIRNDVEVVLIPLRWNWIRRDA